MKNILDQARAKGEAIPAVVEPTLLADPAEKCLEEADDTISTVALALSARREYGAAMAQIATLRAVVDVFFEKVMVMAPEPEIRANRLALLARVLRDFSKIADFSEIVTAG
jgi:glycyl-tRNA synthetase beta chain